MSETKTVNLLEQLTQTQKDVTELKEVISKISRSNSELASTVGTLNKDCADLRDAVKAVHNWIKDQNDKTGRYASTSRY